MKIRVASSRTPPPPPSLVLWAACAFAVPRIPTASALTTPSVAARSTRARAVVVRPPPPPPSPWGGPDIGSDAFARRSLSAVGTLLAAPRRLEENADGVLYVNDRCINCSACSNFAPDVFVRSSSDTAHVVRTQPSPSDVDQLDRSRAALAACPVAAIRVENTARVNHASKAGGGEGAGLGKDDEELARALAISPRLNGLELPFPRPLLDGKSAGVYYLGHHNEKSFGATPYLALGRDHRGRDVSVMVDTPKFSKSAARAVLSLAGSTGPDYLFLTHVDDTADHGRWAEEFPSLRRIFHGGDLGRYNWIGDGSLEGVEVLLSGETGTADGGGGLKCWNLEGEDMDPDAIEGDFAVLHTPGHSPGSISLLFRGAESGGRSEDGEGTEAAAPLGVLFTGDTYAYTTRGGGSMSGFPRYGNDLGRQADTLRRPKGVADRWDVVAPGHGHPRDYTALCEGISSEQCGVAKSRDIQEAVEGLMRRRQT